jgi:hypothetical protein
METITNTQQQKESHNDRIVFGHQVFGLVGAQMAFRVELLVGFDALIVDASDPDFTRLVIRKIRGHYNPELYLKPIFLINHRQVRDTLIDSLHEGILFSYDHLAEVSKKVDEMFMLSTQLDQHLPSNYEAQVFKKVLNFMFTRGRKVFTPMLDVNSVIGYSYPELSVNFERQEEAQVLDILDWAEKEGLIWPDFHERVYLCNNCSGGYLSYREVCPHCDSSNLASQDLVHHFPCAFIGPISEFKNPVDSNLSCPKCNKQLRHIGVDYDKPSVINKCNNCSSSFQDMFVKAKCMSCEQDTDVQYLVSRQINTYRFTKKGRTAAVNGFFSSSADTEDIFGTVPLETMRVMLHYAMERLKRIDGLRTNVSVLYIENMYELVHRMGTRSKKPLLTELVSIIHETISPQDFVSVETGMVFYMTLNDMSLSQAEKIVQELDLKLEQALNKNFNGFKASIRTNTIALEPSIPIAEQLQKLSQALYADR